MNGCTASLETRGLGYRRILGGIPIQLAFRNRLFRTSWIIGDLRRVSSWRRFDPIMPEPPLKTIGCELAAECILKAWMVRCNRAF